MIIICFLFVVLNLQYKIRCKWAIGNIDTIYNTPYTITMASGAY